MLRPRLAAAPIVFIVSLALLAAACGGSSAPKVTFDPARGDDLSHNALIDPSDLPGSGWQAGETDHFETVDDIPTTDNCKTLRTFTSATEDDLAGRAEKQISLPSKTNADLDQTLTLQVEVYHDPKRLPGLLKTYRSFVSTGSHQNCLLDLLKASLPSNADITLKGSKPDTSPPNGGVSYAYDVDVTAGTDHADLHEEHFTWLYGNVSVSVDLQGPMGSYGADLVKAVLSKEQAKVEAAGKAK